VVGDVTSTMACAIAAKKLLVKVAHVEGGIRSGNWKKGSIPPLWDGHTSERIIEIIRNLP